MTLTLPGPSLDSLKLTKVKQRSTHNDCSLKILKRSLNETEIIVVVGLKSDANLDWRKAKSRLRVLPQSLA